MSAQLTIFFLFFGGLQGILFSFFLIRKKLHRSAYLFLQLYFAVMLLQITLKLMSKGWLIDNWRVLYELSYQLPFLYGPLIYLFVRQLIQRDRFRQVDLFHFTPFVILFFYFSLGYSYAESPTMLFPFLFAKFRLVLQLVSVYVYHWLAFHCIKTHADQIDRYYPVQQFQWIRKFIIVSLVVCLGVAVLNFAMIRLYPQLDYVRPGFLILTLFIYWISYEALHHPEVFSVVKGYAVNLPQAKDNIPTLTVHRPPKKYLRSNLTEDQAGRIINSLEKIMDHEKPYLDSGLSIDQLAALVDSNRHQLSQVLNEKLNKSFYDYVNQFRVSEAKSLLTDPGRTNHKIASIAYDAGFNSLSTFNEVFRKSTGQTPSQFKKQGEEISRKKRV